jgi:hypothetical protein
MYTCICRGGQNNGNIKKLRNQIFFLLATLKELQFGNTDCPSICLHSVVLVLVIVLNDRPCERIGKWETCPILKEEGLLVRVKLEHL